MCEGGADVSSPDDRYSYFCCVVFVWLWRWSRGEVWGGGLPFLQIIVVKLFLSPPSTPFLLPVPIIDHTFIVTNCYTSKLSFIFVTNIVLQSFLCRFCVKSMFRLKTMSEFHPPPEKNVGGSSAVWKECANSHTPPNPGHDLKYLFTLSYFTVFCAWLFFY